jgi:glycosyltransferase involved in cell wall biosynthesis
LKPIYFTVTNDLSYDQRMHRICGSLARAGFDVCLVGRKIKTSIPLQKRSFRQKRLSCIFNKGFLFYAEYNLRLFFFLLFRKTGALCAIDLDTILPCFFVSVLKRIPRIYDAHEYFTGMKEVRTRPLVRLFWTLVEKITVPRFRYGYTVSQGLVETFKNRYKRSYLLIRNLPVLKEIKETEKREPFILYQGAVNEGRGFEYLIPAMRYIPYPLVVCGDGNFMPQLKRLLRKYGVKHKVELMGMLLPEKLGPLAQKATIGIGLAEKDGLNQYYALPNKFLDYIHAALPQLAMAYPEYTRINDQFKVAVLIDELSSQKVAETINKMIGDEALLFELQRNCRKAREILCWQEEEKILLQYYRQILKLD